MSSKNLILTALVSLTLSFTSGTAFALYKWTDADGNTHYSDKMPPEQAQQERSILNKRGIEVKRIHAAPSPEERERQKKEAKLRKLQEKQLQAQQAEDRALVGAYRTEEDLLLARDGKLAAVDTAIAVIQGNILRAKRLLLQTQGELDALQESGTPPPAEKVQKMAGYRNRIADNYQTILRYEEKKQSIRNNFDNSLQRYRAIKNGGTSKETMNLQKSASPDDEFLKLNTVVVCNSPKECKQLWNRAINYVTDNSDTPVKYNSETALVTAIPKKDDEISMTVSLIPQTSNESHWIFLDVQCRATAAGNETCAGGRVQKVRAGFRDAVMKAEKQPAPTPSTSPQDQ